LKFISRNYGIEDLLTKLNTVIDVNADIIECGSAYCGTAIIMANYLKEKGIAYYITLEDILQFCY
jgi:hypothetical protein